jgi:uracil-DNA glycosylase family 4
MDDAVGLTIRRRRTRQEGYAARDGRAVPCRACQQRRLRLGGNRTGRVFTGDRSGDWLFGSLHRTGLANQPTSIRAGDGLRLRDTYVAAAVRCAPPGNSPTTEERDRCQPFLERELALLVRLRVVVALWRVLGAAGHELPSPRPRFAHGVEVETPAVTILGCYHPSQQNTFTGRLTEPMLDAVLARAREIAASS